VHPAAAKHVGCNIAAPLLHFDTAADAMGQASSAPGADLRALTARLEAAIATPQADAVRVRVQEVSADRHLHKTYIDTQNGLVDTSSPDFGRLKAAVLQLDPNAAAACARVVPSQVSDAHWWTCYIHQLHAAMLANGADAAQPAGGRSAGGAVPAPRVDRADGPPAAAQHRSSVAPAAGAPAPGAAPAGEDDADVEEQLLLTLDECFVYKVPPRPAASGYRAFDWGLDSPLLTGYARLVARGPAIAIGVWQRGDAAPASAAGAGTGGPVSLAMAPTAAGHKLVAVCRVPVPGLPSAAPALAHAPPPPPAREQPLEYWVEPVADSSRYFVLRLVSRDQRTAQLGIGFREREAAFSFRAAIDDYVAFCKRQAGVAPEAPAASAAGSGGDAHSDAPAEGGAAVGSTAAPRDSEFKLAAGQTLRVQLQVKGVGGGVGGAAATATAAAAAAAAAAGARADGGTSVLNGAAASQPKRGGLAPPPPPPNFAVPGAAVAGDTGAMVSHGMRAVAGETTSEPGPVGPAAEAAAGPDEPVAADDWGDFESAS
jgi:hypothetical protein